MATLDEAAPLLTALPPRDSSGLVADADDRQPHGSVDAWMASTVGDARIEQREGLRHVVVGSAAGAGERRVVDLDPEQAYELQFDIRDLDGVATLRLSADGTPLRWVPASSARRLLVANVRTLEALIYQDTPFAAAIESASVQPLGAVRRLSRVTDELELRDLLDPDLHLAGAIDRIVTVGEVTVTVDGELLVVRNEGPGLGGLLLGWSAAKRGPDSLPIVVDSIDGEVVLANPMQTLLQPPELPRPLTTGVNLVVGGDSDPTAWMHGEGPFTLIIAAAGADALAIESILRRDHAAELGTDDALATIAWARDRVHRGTLLGPGDQYDPTQYLALRRGRCVAICGPMSALNEWMLRTLGIPARRVQFLGHAYLDGSRVGDTHVAVEAWLADEKRWVLSDPTFACFWTHDGADPSVPLDTTTLWHAVKAGSTPIPILSPEADLPLPARSPAEYYIPFERLFGVVEFTGTWVRGPLGEHRVPRSRLGPPWPEQLSD